LMDGPSFARDMEGCYRQAWRTWCERGARAELNACHREKSGLSDTEIADTIGRHRTVVYRGGFSASQKTSKPFAWRRVASGDD